MLEKSGKDWRNSSRRNEEAEPKRKQCQVVVVKVKSDAIKNDTE